MALSSLPSHPARQLTTTPFGLSTHPSIHTSFLERAELLDDKRAFNDLAGPHGVLHAAVQRCNAELTAVFEVLPLLVLLLPFPFFVQTRCPSMLLSLFLPCLPGVVVAWWRATLTVL